MLIGSSSCTHLSPISWKTLTNKFKLSITVLSAITLLIISWAGWDLFNNTSNYGWVSLGIWAILTIPGSIPLPHLGIIVTIGDYLLMSIAVIYGISPCVVVTVFFAFAVLVVMRGTPIFIQIFNFCTLVCNSFLFSIAFLFSAQSYSFYMNYMILPVLIMSLVSFLFSISLIAIMLACTRNNKIFRLWVKKSPLLIINHIVSAVGVILAILIEMQLNSPFAILLVFPIILFNWAWTRQFAQGIEREIST